MSMKYVILHYGPVESFNLGLELKPQFICGVRDRLLRLGYRVDIKAVETINCFLIEMCGYEIFKCNIKHLGFNMPFDKDPVCQIALKAVETAEAKFIRAREYLWLRDFTDKYFKHLENSNDITFDLTTFRSMGKVKTCAECCGITLRKNDPCGVDTNWNIAEKSEFDQKIENISIAFSNIKDISMQNEMRLLNDKKD